MSDPAAPPEQESPAAGFLLSEEKHEKRIFLPNLPPEQAVLYTIIIWALVVLVIAVSLLIAIVKI